MDNSCSWIDEEGWLWDLDRVLKGLVEVFMLSFHGVLVIVISLVEGLIVDLIFIAIRKINTISLCLAGDLSSSRNVFIVKYIIIPSLPLSIFTLMYILSFISGLFFAGYLGKGLKYCRRFVKKTYFSNKDTFIVNSRLKKD